MNWYSNIGELLAKQEKHGWGNSIVEQISADLRKEYPASTGYSANNPWLMRQLYNEYTNIEFIEQLVQYLRSQEVSSLFDDYEIDELENSKAKLDFVNLSLIR